MSKTPKPDLSVDAYFAECQGESETFLRDYDSVVHILIDLPQAVKRLHRETRRVLGQVKGAHLGDGPMYIADSAIIEPGAYVQGPAYIGANVVVRHGAYVRENVIMFEVVCWATQVKRRTRCSSPKPTLLISRM